MAMVLDEAEETTKKKGKKKELLPAPEGSEIDPIPEGLSREELIHYFNERYSLSKRIQAMLLKRGIPAPREPQVPGLIRDAKTGEVMPPRDLTTLSSQALGEYLWYYTAMLEWVGRLLWIADIDYQAARSVQEEVEGFYDLEPDIQQYGHRDERVAKRNLRKTVQTARLIAEEKRAALTALEREYDRYERLLFAISREITRRERKPREDDLA